MRARRFRFGIQTWLVLLVVLATVPITLFSAVILYQLAETQHLSTVATLSQRAEASANAVAARLSALLGSLNALATSNAVRTGDLAELYEHASQLQALYPEILAISLVGPDGGQLFHTLLPLGVPLPPSSDLEMIQRILDTGRPGVSSPFLGSVSHQNAAAVGIRVMMGGRAPHVLRIGIATTSFNQVLAEQHLPQDWPSVLFDRHGITVARTRAPEASVGKKVSPELQAIQRQGHDGVFEDVTREGEPVISAVFKVPGWDWWVAVGVPTESFHGPLREFLWRLGLGGLAFFAMSWGTAVWLSRHLVRKIRQASRASMALGGGGVPEFQWTGIRELDAIGDSLDAVRRRETLTQSELCDARTAQRQASDALTQARRDTLTGLPSRGLFLERAEMLRAQCGDGTMGLAVLLLDLDGFKQVNDTYGHDIGDEVLVKTADILSAVVRGGDVAGRLGGDEFVLCALAPRQEIHATANAIAHRILAAIGEIGFGVGVSIGISICPRTGASLSYLMREADEAMYAAKHAGKNRAVIQETRVEDD